MFEKLDKFSLIPNSRLGPFVFDTDIRLYIEEYALKTNGAPILIGDELQQSYFFQENESLISIRSDSENQIEAIECFNTLRIKGINLIGKSVLEIEDIVGAKFEFDDEPFELDGAEFEIAISNELGIQLWVLEEHVDSIFCFCAND